MADNPWWGWLDRVFGAFSGGKIVIRKIGPQWYVLVANITPTPVNSMADGIAVADGVIRMLRRVGLTNA